VPGQLLDVGRRTFQIRTDDIRPPTTRTERANSCDWVGLGRVVRVGSGRHVAISCMTEAPSTPLGRVARLLGRQYPTTDTRHRNPTPTATPHHPTGGPRVRNDYARPYVLEFFGGCVDIRACFFAFSPTWDCFAPENVLLQVSCMVRFPFGATKKLPLGRILAVFQLFFAFAVFFTWDAAFPQGSVSLPPAFCYLK
jgi:hypothetical protein